MTLTLTLTLVLCGSGSVPGIGSLVEARHGHHGGHSGSSGSGYSFLSPDPNWMFDDAGLAWVAVELLSRAQVHLELDSLKARIPGFGGVAALLTSGIILVLVGVGFSIAGLVEVAITGMFTWVLGVGLGALAVGIVLIVLGAVDLLAIADTRNRYDYRIRSLEQRLATLDATTRRAPGPLPAMVLARF